MKPQSPATLHSAEQRIAALITPELEGQAVQVLTESLGATVMVRAGRGEHGINYEERPDNAIRLAAAVKVIEFSRGKPATSLVISNTPTSQSGGKADLGAVLASMPEEFVRARVDDLIAAARKVAPVDISTK